MFEVGRNLAITPGKVIYQNELMQLIQYAPSTETVLKRPLLIVPPWINKYLRARPQRRKNPSSAGRRPGSHGVLISWVNPDARLAEKGFEDYMRRGRAGGARRHRTRRPANAKSHAIGYCVGGTLLAITLGRYGGAGTTSASQSATLFATQVDFTYAGDLKVFVDEEQVEALEAADGRARLSRRHARWRPSSICCGPTI